MKKRIIALLLLVELLMMLVLVYLFYLQKGGANITDESLNYIMTLLSIAISTWLGFNIYNVIEKK